LRLGDLGVERLAIGRDPAVADDIRHVKSPFASGFRMKEIGTFA
jgi:hypothetical protein